jgi:transposase
MQGKKHYAEKLFTSFQLSDRVPEDNFYRRLKDVLDLRWLYKKTKKYYGSEGQKSIDPVVFFKLTLIGYLENLGSDRRIMQTAQMRMDMLYFLGYDIDEQLPWHSTLSRTRQLFGEDVFKDLFRKVLSKCIEKGMVAGKRQAVDSVPIAIGIKTNASMDSFVKKEVLNDAEKYAAELHAADEDENEDKPQDNHTVSANKNKSVQQHHAWKEKAYKGMPGGRKKSEDGSEPEEKYLPKFVSNHTHYSTTDADARVSVKPGKARQLNYLAQVSVDTASHVITNMEAHLADKKDSQCLPSVLENTITNLRSQGLIVEEVLADGGYSSGEALKALEQNNITGYIPNFGMYKPTREGFIYHPEGDYYECSKGAKLVFKKIKTAHDGAYQLRHYRSSSKDCRSCPLKLSCIGKSNEKKIEDTVDKPYYDRMHERLQTAKAKRMKKLRSSTVEPVIGTLSNFLAMKRVNTRGLTQANKCILMAAVAYNLKKLLNYKVPKVMAAVKSIKETQEKRLQTFLFGVTDLIRYHNRKKTVLSIDSIVRYS